MLFRQELLMLVLGGMFVGMLYRLIGVLFLPNA